VREEEKNVIIQREPEFITIITNR